MTQSRIELLKNMTPEMVWFLFATDFQRKRYDTLVLNLETGEVLESFMRMYPFRYGHLLDFTPASLRSYHRHIRTKGMRLVLNPFKVPKDVCDYVYKALNGGPAED